MFQKIRSSLGNGGVEDKENTKKDLNVYFGEEKKKITS